MSLLGNLLWLLFGGLIVGLGYIIGGALLCLTVVGIPFGVDPPGRGDLCAIWQRGGGCREPKFAQDRL